MKIYPTFVAFLFIASTDVYGSVIVSAAETSDGHVRFDYSGTLNLEGLPASPFIFAFDRHQLHRGQGGFQNQFSGITMRSLGAAPYSSNAVIWLDISTVIPPASLFSGDSFAFGRDFLTVEEAGVVGDIWSGSGFMQFNNTTFDGLGIDLSQDAVWILDNAAADTITITATSTVVPEPSSLVLCGIALIGIAAMNRKRRSQS